MVTPGHHCCEDCGNLRWERGNVQGLLQEILSVWGTPVVCGQAKRAEMLPRKMVDTGELQDIPKHLSTSGSWCKVCVSIVSFESQSKQRVAFTATFDLPAKVAPFQH